MAKILGGRVVRDEIALELAERVKKLARPPRLAIIQIGDNPASNAYVRQKKLFGEKIGAKVEHHKLAENAGQEEVAALIEKLNDDNEVDGIILQLPLPDYFLNYNTATPNRMSDLLLADELVAKIKSEKDVDGLTVASPITPATARGVMALLDYYQIPVAGKKVTVVGRSRLVGKPIAELLRARDAIVTVCHRGTSDLAAETKPADIIIVAAGQAKLIGAKHVAAGQTVIDVGISRTNDNKLIGDVDFVAVEKIVAAISPVPGGVGPLTVALLFSNLLEVCVQ